MARRAVIPPQSSLFIEPYCVEGMNIQLMKPDVQRIDQPSGGWVPDMDPDRCHHGLSVRLNIGLI